MNSVKSKIYYFISTTPETLPFQGFLVMRIACYTGDRKPAGGYLNCIRI